MKDDDKEFNTYVLLFIILVIVCIALILTLLQLKYIHL